MARLSASCWVHQATAWGKSGMCRCSENQEAKGNQLRSRRLYGNPDKSLADLLGNQLMSALVAAERLVEARRAFPHIAGLTAKRSLDAAAFRSPRKRAVSGRIAAAFRNALRMPRVGWKGAVRSPRNS